jgi:hypothetical protein
MTNRSASERAARAEARRRARLAARGGDLDDAEAEEEPPAPPHPGRGSFLRRLFPSAPPLPGKGDPLAGFTYSGRLRPLVEIPWLLRKNPLAWLVPGVLSGGALVFGGPASGFGFLGTMLYFVCLIAAGWLGWQRPSLYGVTAALLGLILFLPVAFAFFADRGLESLSDYGPPEAVISSLAFQGLLLALVGFVSGWYGGYLRRRQAEVGRQTRRSRR